MSFTLKELITDILDSDLDQGEKIAILDRLYRSGKVSEGLYLRRNDGSDDFECWFRNVDENGQTEHGPTNFTSKETVNACITGTKSDYKPIQK